MPIRSISLYTYRTRGGGWTTPQLGVLRFVQALKNVMPMGARERVRVNGVLRSLGEENRRDAFTWFADMAISVLDDELKTTAVVLVPIPDSRSTLGATQCRTVSLAEAIARKSAAIVSDLLRWDQPMRSARSGVGSREPLELYSHIRLRTGLGTGRRPFVLVDDVITSGGHVRACAAFLRGLGADVRLAICAARSDRDPPADPFERRIDEWPDFVVTRPAEPPRDRRAAHADT